MKLLIATTNPGKIREFSQMLAGMNIEFTDLTQHRELEPVEETGATFAENAALKASQYARALNQWALADDSGLAIDALGGKPGVHSARWAELHNAGQGNAANTALVLRQLENIPPEKRAARFVCALALANPQGNLILTASDTVEGSILTSERGDGGFGYDPIFLVNGTNQTTAELPAERKNQISHRGKALKQLAEMLRSM